jgi:purine-binding chemotaxis protein CheW
VSTLRYCTFEVGEMLIGIEVGEVREVLVDPDVTPVPLAPAGVLGLLSCRGEIVTVIDSHHRLGASRTREGMPSTHVIIGLDGETVSLPIDTEGDVIEVDSRRRLPVPGTVRPSLRRLLDAIVELDSGRLMLALAPERTLAIAS